MPDLLIDRACVLNFFSRLQNLRQQDQDNFTLHPKSRLMLLNPGSGVLLRDFLWLHQLGHAVHELEIISSLSTAERRGAGPGGGLPRAVVGHLCRQVQLGLAKHQ